MSQRHPGMLASAPADHTTERYRKAMVEQRKLDATAPGAEDVTEDEPEGDVTETP